jgi:hypothetical protein
MGWFSHVFIQKNHASVAYPRTGYAQFTRNVGFPTKIIIKTKKQINKIQKNHASVA